MVARDRVRPEQRVPHRLISPFLAEPDRNQCEVLGRDLGDGSWLMVAGSRQSGAGRPQLDQRKKGFSRVSQTLWLMTASAVIACFNPLWFSRVSQTGRLTHTFPRRSEFQSALVLAGVSDRETSIPTALRR